ncbi:MAG: hypothetical protein ACYTGV_02440 [Planctomycetota bacterium]|jgi:hypothetical protein
MTVAGTPGAQQYQAQINAMKAVISLVEVDETTFRRILQTRPHPTIVTGKSGALWFKKTVYMTTYDGFVFLHRSKNPLDFSGHAPDAVIVEAESVNIPFMS